jgi:hypothetical protein
MTIHPESDMLHQTPDTEHFNGEVVPGSPEDPNLDTQIAIPKETIDAYEPPVFVDAPVHHLSGGIGAPIPDTRDIRAAFRAEHHVRGLHRLHTHHDVIEKLGRKNVFIEKPKSDTIQGISHEDYSNAYDYKVIYQEHMVFSSYQHYEKDRLLQELFGHAKGGMEYNKTLDRNVYGIKMTYYRDDAPTWESANRIPAKYFFKGRADELLADKNVSPADIKALEDAGILNDKGQFINQKELATLSKAYAKFDPDNAMPIGDENIEAYINRLTRVMHQAKDGTFFIAKPGTNIDELLEPRPQAVGNPTFYVSDNRYENNGFTTPVRLTYDRPWRVNVAGRASRRIMERVMERRWGR